MVLSAARQNAAIAALRNLGGTYITKHAPGIALDALAANTIDEAIAAVQRRIGHTSVGARRFAELARVAREAAEAIVDDREPGRTTT